MSELDYDRIAKLLGGKVVGEVESNFGQAPRQPDDARLNHADELIGSATYYHEGKTYLKNTKISIATIIAEVARGQSIVNLAENMDLDIGDLKNFFDGLSIHFDTIGIK